MTQTTKQQKRNKKCKTPKAKNVLHEK